MLGQKRLFLVFITVSIAVITYLHYSTLPGVRDLHNIFSELYYLPLLLGALVYGLKGAVITFIFISLFYAPHVIMNWTDDYAYIANQVLHAAFSGFFTILAGILIEREKRYRERSEKDRYLAGLGQAAAAIVHDLKNPLLIITGFARRIRDRRGDIEKASQAVLDSARDMQLIVHDVLDFAKPVNLNLTEKDLGSIVRKVYDYCATKANKENVVLSVYTPDESVKIPVDGFHLERALINLVNNAIEASGKGDVVVIKSETSQDSVNIHIKDYGEGMDEETLENIFIPFYTKKNSGTGLGMAIAKKIIEGHNGKIHIRSGQQMGTEVLIELPISR